MENEELNLKLTTDEINTVLESLGSQPFTKVYGLIGKIQKQATEELNAATTRNAGKPATATDG
jgi:hypothetical protein